MSLVPKMRNRHRPVDVMLGVKVSVLLFDAFWRQVCNSATESIHAEIMRMRQAIALG